MSAACAARSSTCRARSRSSGRLASIGRFSGTSITYSASIDDLRSVASWQASTIISSLTRVSRTGTSSWSYTTSSCSDAGSVGDLTVLVSE